VRGSLACEDGPDRYLSSYYAEVNMPVAKGQPIDPDETKARILRTAARLFQANGVHAVGVNKIAQDAGASKLSLYRHFDSKHELVVRTSRDRSQRVHDWIRRVTTDADPGDERVLSIFDALIGWYGEPGFVGCGVLNAVVDTRGDTDADSVQAIGRLHLRRYRDLLEERLLEIGFDHLQASSLAGQLLVLIEGATAVTAVDGPGSGAGADARQAAKTLLAGASRRAPA
jgi:AcrR family transcriptional regulator